MHEHTLARRHTRSSYSPRTHTLPKETRILTDTTDAASDEAGRLKLLLSDLSSPYSGHAASSLSHSRSRRCTREDALRCMYRGCGVLGGGRKREDVYVGVGVWVCWCVGRCGWVWVCVCVCARARVSVRHREAVTAGGTPRDRDRDQDCEPACAAARALYSKFPSG